MELVEPTAAKDSSPANRPTTMMSAALYNNCRMPDRITGIAKDQRAGKSFPCVKLIS